jgi:hypothetical protein
MHESAWPKSVRVREHFHWVAAPSALDFQNCFQLAWESHVECSARVPFH